MMKNWGTLDTWLREIHRALKPNGILGIEDHRAAPGMERYPSCTQHITRCLWLGETCPQSSGAWERLVGGLLCDGQENGPRRGRADRRRCNDHAGLRNTRARIPLLQVRPLSEFEGAMAPPRPRVLWQVRWPCAPR
jgi:hypothetical protein